MKEQITILIFLILINYCFLSKNTSDFLSENNYEITEGIYLIQFKENYLNLGKNSTIFFRENPLNEKQSTFIIYNDNDEQIKNYFYIKEKNTFRYLIASEIPQQITFSFRTNNMNRALWKIIPHTKENKVLIYYIQNKYTGEYLSFNYYYKNSALNAFCQLTKEQPLSVKNEFKFIKLYTEQSYEKTSELLENEPIDVLIKYIDLDDSNLKRKYIKQLSKDEDNNELKYSLRSVLQNIPWIRKIYILMPNEKVSFLKPEEEIKDKIIYIKDHDLLGFDTSSSSLFLFKLYKMKKFGLSENFIYMDDDYFIGKPLKKSDFFYEINGTINPFLITDSFKVMNKTYLEDLHNRLYKKVGRYSQTPIDFHFRKISTLLFLYKIFGEDDDRGGYPLIEAEFNHNAMPLKISDIEEINRYVENLYEFSKETLQSKYRHIRSLQPQALLMSYARNKYDRWAKKIWARFYTLDEIGSLSYKFVPTLFVINTSDKSYHYNKYKKEILKLILIFPNKTDYELNDENEEQVKKYMNEKKINATLLLDMLKIKKKNNDNDYLWNILKFIVILIIFILYIRRKIQLYIYSDDIDLSDFY